MVLYKHTSSYYGVNIAPNYILAGLGGGLNQQRLSRNVVWNIVGLWNDPVLTNDTQRDQQGNSLIHTDTGM